MNMNHEGQLLFTCDQCNANLSDKNTLRKHILQSHKSFWPCRNYFAPESQCRYEKLCHFSHVAVAEGRQRCYKCGIEVISVTLLMEHRKTQHKEKCKDALLNRCRFNQQSCYLNHTNTLPSPPPNLPKNTENHQQDFQASNRPQQPPWSSNKADQTRLVLNQIVNLIKTLL